MALITDWKFDEGSGNVISDSVGTYAGLTYNTTWVSGRLNSCLSFNGTNSYVDLGSTLNLTTPFTITMWIKRNIATGWRALIVKGQNTIDQYDNYYVAINSTGNLYFSIGTGTAYRYFQTSTTVDTNWHHLTFVFGSSTDMRIYIDSVIQPGTYAGTATTLVGNANKLLIGAATATQEIFSGLIDETKLFNHAMTTTQVQSEYQSVACSAVIANFVVT